MDTCKVSWTGVTIRNRARSHARHARRPLIANVANPDSKRFQSPPREAWNLRVGLL